MPDRVLHRPAARIAVGLDHFARDGRRQHLREIGQEVVGRPLQLEPDRVAVHRQQPLHRRVVVELARLLRLGDGGVGALEEVVEHLQVRRTQLRIEHPLPRIDVVGRRQLALAALERRIVVEIDARLDPERPHEAVGGDLRQRDRGVRDELERPGQVIVGVRGVEDRAIDVIGIQVVRGLRIEAGLRDGERNAQHLVRVGLRRGRRRDAGRQHEHDDPQASPRGHG